MDQHVTVGGESFDVLEGTDRIVPLDRGVELQLSSEYRLSTSFNGYAELWTGFIMRDTLNYILRNRCGACGVNKLARLSPYPPEALEQVMG